MHVQQHFLKCSECTLFTYACLSSIIIDSYTITHMIWCLYACIHIHTYKDTLIHQKYAHLNMENIHVHTLEITACRHKKNKDGKHTHYVCRHTNFHTSFGFFCHTLKIIWFVCSRRDKSLSFFPTQERKASKNSVSPFSLCSFPFSVSQLCVYVFCVCLCILCKRS